MLQKLFFILQFVIRLREAKTGNQITSFIVFVQAVAQRVLSVWSRASYINHKPLAFRLSSRRRFVHPQINIYAGILMVVSFMRNYTSSSQTEVWWSSAPCGCFLLLTYSQSCGLRRYYKDVLRGPANILINFIDETTSYLVRFFGQGYGLLCVGYPLSDLEVETQDEDEVCQMKCESFYRISFFGGHGKSSEGLCKIPCAELFPWLAGILATIWTILCKGPLGKCTRTYLVHLVFRPLCQVVSATSLHTVYRICLLNT